MRQVFTAEEIDMISELPWTIKFGNMDKECSKRIPFGFTAATSCNGPHRGKRPDSVVSEIEREKKIRRTVD